MNSGAPQPIPYFLMGQIRQGIISGRYAPGSALREQTLEVEYGTSRGPLREALRLLQLRGLVKHEPRRGFRVREYSAEIIGQIYRLRGLLERHGIEALAGKPLTGLIDELRAENAAMARHFAAKNIEGYLEANVAFHAAIMKAADNEPLQKSIETLNEMAQPIRFALLASRFEKSTAMDEHRKIIAFLAKGDLAGAAACIEDHVLRNMPNAMGLYGEQVMHPSSAEATTPPGKTAKPARSKATAKSVGRSRSPKET
jgi:DNA-binding GntR family transcriptional regulator